MPVDNFIGNTIGNGCVVRGPARRYCLIMMIADVAAASAKTGLDFWAAVGVAAAIATALATGVSTAFAVWWRYQDRTEAEFVGHLLRAGGTGKHGEPGIDPRILVRITNVGDGTAFKVTIQPGAHIVRDPYLTPERGSGIKIHPPIPILRTGDFFVASLECESLDVWNDAQFTVSWWPPPTRKTRAWFRSREMRKNMTFKDFSDVPQVD